MNNADCERFWSKVDKTAHCWNWKGAKSRGYGIFQLDGRAQRAHRIAYKMTFGEITSDVFVCHACDNPSCVRPDHLWAGTANQNNADRHSKGRSNAARGNNHGMRKHPERHASKNDPFYQRGERNSRAKMTWKQVQELRLRYSSRSSSLTNLAKEYGIGFSTADKIVRYETWKEAS